MSISFHASPGQLPSTFTTCLSIVNINAHHALDQGRGRSSQLFQFDAFATPHSEFIEKALCW
jgi:hypothetical protein